ncbi:MAG: Flp family type IVb pilin [Acidimicrobiia bacterium]
MSAARAQRFARDERGASFVEYAMLLALVVVVCVAAVTMIGTTTGESLSSTASRLP